MGCGATSLAPPPTQVQTFKPAESRESNGATASDIDYSIGFTPKATQKFAVTSPKWKNPKPDFGIPDTQSDSDASSRDEADEFRVLRVSSLSGQVTLFVAGGKHKKPQQYDSNRVCPRAHEQPTSCTKCPFCMGNERKTPPNILSFDENGVERPAGHPCDNWKVRVFPNIFPMLICPFQYYGQAHQDALHHIPHSAVARGVHHNFKTGSRDDPTCQQVDAEGVSEVFVESAVHNALLALQEPRNIEYLLRALVIRCKELSKQPWVKQLLIFKQYGPLSGGSLVHPHSQVVSLPVLPPQLQARLEFAMHVFEQHARCATCLACIDPFVKEQPNSLDRSISRSSRRSESSRSKSGDPNSPSVKSASGRCSPNGSRNSDPSRLVHISDHFVVSVPYASSSQYAMTIAPKRHSSDFTDMTQAEIKDLAFVLALLSQAIYKGLDDPSYNCFIRTGPIVQSVRLGMREVSKREIKDVFHWICELRPRFPADLGGFEIASGIRVVTGLPEDHAEQLREWVQERLDVGVEPIQPEPPPPTFSPMGDRRGSANAMTHIGSWKSTEEAALTVRRTVASMTGALSKPTTVRAKTTSIDSDKNRHPHALAPLVGIGGKTTTVE